MCIRDSIKADIQLSVTTPKNSKAPVPMIMEFGFIFPPGFRLPPPAPNTCLLYTSDAADERSSVDLGGRRIIKKKKTKEITGDNR